MKKRALIAMSGGVDSSVSALLMKEKGYECIGVTMKLHDYKDTYTEQEKTCGTSSDVEDAKAVCDRIGIPHYVVDFKDSFKEKVMDKFVECYRCGLTPNPCIDCNRHLKFAGLHQKAKELECDVIVTGHYVRVEKDGETYHLLKGLDASKDQSYVLYNLTKEQLAHTEFPLGAFTKEEVRKLAEEYGFVNAKKKESQDICFIPDGNYRDFIEKTGNIKVGCGNFVDKEGNVIGIHQGYYHYTIGQRKGLGISAKSPYYVIEICPEKNEVVLGANEDLFHRHLIADDFNWIEEVEEGKEIQAKVRYGHKAAPAVYRKLSEGKVAVTFVEPQRAFTKGQAVVLYDGDKLLGGGTIVDYGEDMEEGEMEHYKFFQHKDCEYFPCHKTEQTEEFNCLFCFCPLYFLGEECGGNFVYTKTGVKDCSGCMIPHGKNGYEYVCGKIRDVNRK